MRRLVFLLSLVLSCSHEVYELPKGIAEEQPLKNVKGFEDCIFKEVEVKLPDYGNWSLRLNLVRCPNSTTNVKYDCGKNCQHNITVVDSPFEKEPD